MATSGPAAFPLRTTSSAAKAAGRPLRDWALIPSSQIFDDLPFTDNAPKGPDEFFPAGQMTQLIEITRSINASADVHTA